MNLLGFEKNLGNTGLDPLIQLKVIKSIVALLVLILLKIFVNIILARKGEDENLIYRWQKMSSYLFTFCFSLLLEVFGIQASSLSQLILVY